MEKPTRPKRIDYLDIARGIGILLVVLAHNDLSAVSPFVHRVIYSFHIPLFFFLSGFFLKTDVPFWEFFKKRFHSLLKPYIVIILIIYLTSVSFSNMSFATALGRIVKSFYASGIYINWVQLWFLPHLFVVSLFAYLFYRAGGKVFRNQAIRWAGLVLVLVVAIPFLQDFYPYKLTLLGKTYELFGLPLSLDLVLLSGFYFILGNETRQVTSEKTFESPIIPLGTGLAILGLNYFYNELVDFNLRLYPQPVANTLAAMLGILFVLALSRQIEMRTSRFASLLKYIGKISIFILIFHVPIQDFWARKLFAVTNSEVLFYVGGFLASVIISALIYEIFIGPNPVALRLFGRPPSTLTFRNEVIRPQRAEEESTG